MLPSKSPGNSSVNFEQIKKILISSENEPNSVTEFQCISLWGVLSKRQWQLLMLEIFQWDKEEHSRDIKLQNSSNIQGDYSYIVQGDYGQSVAWNILKKRNEEYYQVCMRLTNRWLKNLSLGATVSLMDKLNSSYKFHLNHWDYCTLIDSSEDYEEWEFGEFFSPVSFF
ncbi:hypothetical protein PCC8801_2081 [Rippkaea orientalis PCC 8801]|uniref:Uncharacterized protein n=1 Tax=Rippkaea orientalis (strain PCC 8801 / RF-1) TaxID=41431 RepID=B7JZ36_RIPO1|nr:hypothetical protein [Rippkaea orientalis]ACK66113.1 hypothetical protein PCC8801_2081 [Rippkaea orientalis PCC 8801]